MINVVEWTRLEPWRVARARTDRDETVIVKWSGPHAARTHTEEWRLRTEVAALRFLAEDLGVRVAPRVLADDLVAGHVVLEDLAPRTPLDGLLRRDGAGAHATRLAAFAHARGELGALTAGHASLYYRRRSTLGPVDPTADLLGHVGGLRTSGTPQADALGVPARGGVARELEAALDELADPGPFLVFSNGDPDINNVLVHESGLPGPRLIDFEFAGYRHALHDAAYLHVPGPAWMWVGASTSRFPLADAADSPASARTPAAKAAHPSRPEAPGSAALPDLGDIYRRALAAGVPEAEDEGRYGRGLVAACVAYALSRLTRLPVLDARPAGDDSRAQLVATMEATARTADTHRALPHLAGWCRHLAAALRRRWPDADIDVAALSPYTPRAR
ncbi:phosphotransferase [Nonomuraea sp. PA05]|uniref:phosphotransferase n=1 Tax=Nonomuraea sp. PA05 TaxID=2604466 RepID=UPI001CA30503|nr:phosphotransferase [Nonomuraea sp. PA05]